MKIRAGFVSNSSSSSFCLVGAYFSDIEDMLKAGTPEFTKKLVEEGFPNKEDYEDYGDFIDAVGDIDPLSAISEATGLEAIGYYDDQGIYIGLSFTSIDDDETPRKFKADIKKELEKSFTELSDFGIQEGTVYS